MQTRSCLLLALMLATAFTLAAQAAEKITIVVGGLERQINLPATLADKLGFYKEQGLDVQLVGTTAGVNAENELLAGAVQAVVGFYDHTIDLQSKGKQLVGIVQFLRVPGEAEMVSDPKIMSELRYDPDFTRIARAIWDDLRAEVRLGQERERAA